MNVLAVRDVTRSFADGGSVVHALQGVTLALEPAEVTLLMGPSGSGKTTLLQIMGCLMQPSSGDVQVHGQAVGHLAEEARGALRLRKFGFVFQAYNLFPTLSATENVCVALDLLGVGAAEARERARSLLQQLGLGHRLDAHPRKLSGGEKQRVAIARALAGAPDIILADEPTAALDGENGQRAMELFRGLARGGRAVAIVTHDTRVTDYADRLVWMEDGRVLRDRRAN